MTKNNGKYYLHYGAPGTEFSGYADGVVVGDNPLGPFTPQSLPFSFKPGGFARGQDMVQHSRITGRTTGIFPQYQLLLRTTLNAGLVYGLPDSTVME
jgi:hypothetical protein